LKRRLNFQHGSVLTSLLRELLLLLGFLLLGLLAVPVAVYHLGGLVFGAYAGGTGSLGSFITALYAALGDGDRGAWLLVIAPYGIAMLLRACLWSLRRRRHSFGAASGEM